jgi:hypothetical protein
MRMRTFVYVALTFWLAGAANVLGVWQMQPETFRLLSARGEENIQAAERFVDISYGGGEILGAVVVFFDPKTHLSLWVFGVAGAGSRPGLLESFRRRSVLSLAEDRLVFFTMRESSLAVRASNERATSLEDAVNRAVAAVNARKSELVKLDVLLHGADVFTLIMLRELGRDFFALKNSAGPGPSPKVVGASFSNGKWDVTVVGPNQDRAVVTLNTSFELQGVRRIE